MGGMVMAKWIKCADRLPEDYEIVLAYRDGDGWITVADYIDRKFIINGELHEAHAITHWQQLPNSPKR